MGCNYLANNVQEQDLYDRTSNKKGSASKE